MEAILHDGMLARECEIIVTDAWPGILEHSGWPMSRDIVNVAAMWLHARVCVTEIERFYRKMT